MNDERSPDLTQALLLDLRAQLEEARRERDEARETARIRIDALNKSRERWYARWNETTEQVDCLEEQIATLSDRRLSELGAMGSDLADARASAEQGAKVAEALAAEKAALVARVGVLSAALRGLRYPGEPERFCDHAAAPCDRCDAARAALEVEP